VARNASEKLPDLAGDFFAAGAALAAAGQPALAEIGHQTAQYLALRLASEQITVKLLNHALGAGLLHAYWHTRSL